jgi:2-amino-4-hydroxy-6-hydroxymethyldihydropteridine diphosphokinase
MVKQKHLSAEHVLISTPHFPYNKRNHPRKYRERHRALLGIGGNIGDVLRRFEHLYWYWQRSRLVDIVTTSPIVKNPPFGYTQQADFLNAVIEIETGLSPKALLHYILHTEKRFGRKRSFRDAPRTLDIDMLLYEDVVMDTERLTLPHPGFMQRLSVQIPLRYLKKNRKTGQR